MTGQSLKRPRARVAFVLPSYAGGGAERVVFNLVALTEKVEFEPTLVVIDPRGPLKGKLSPRVPVVELGHRSLRSGLIALTKALRELRPDIIFSTFTHINLPILALKPLFRSTRLIVREANLPSANLPRMPLPWLFRYGYRHFYKNADAVVASSNRMRNELIELGVPSDKLELLHNPVDGAALRAASYPPKRVAGPGLRFVASGRLGWQKGFDRMIQAMSLLPHDSHLTILGEGPERENLNGLVLEMRLSNRVALPGYLSNPAPWIAGADAFVMPSRFEGMPNAALESLALGTPVIATPEAGGIGEIGVVQTAEFGPQFMSEMTRLNCNPVETARPSLLPPSFDIDNVATQFQALLGRHD